MSRHIKNFHKTENPRTPSVRMRSRNTKNEPAKKIIDTVESVGSAVLLPTHSSAPHQVKSVFFSLVWQDLSNKCPILPFHFFRSPNSSQLKSLPNKLVLSPRNNFQIYSKGSPSRKSPFRRGFKWIIISFLIS